MTTNTVQPVPSRAPEYLARDKLAWLLIMQTLLVLPLLINLPHWLWLVWAFTGLWRTQVFRSRWRAPSRAVKTGVTLTCAAGLLLSYGGISGTELMVGLLVCAFVLKLLEVNSARDARLLVLIGFFILAGQLLFSQSPLAAAYSLGCLIVLLASWRSLHWPGSQPYTQGLKAGAVLFLQALPCMLVLFVVLPRIGPLWAIPNQQVAQSGFSDSLSPGDLGQLALNSAPAFRVEFLPPATQPPASNQLYWRGLILDSFDGRTWRQRHQWGLRGKHPATPQGDRLSYSIILEPHGQPWLFSLMTPEQVQVAHSRRPTRITRDHLLFHPLPVTQRLRYQVTSQLGATPTPTEEMAVAARTAYTHLPAEGNPQTRALAQSWRAQGLDDRAIVAHALSLFNRDFVYSLQPPVLGQDAVDEFLFVTRKGFCEHFASSLAVLLRAAQIPARVVVGYQGGRWNPVEGYLLVSQSDAHAWTEVWLPGQGWQTIDPTAAVAPERIEQGLEDALTNEEQGLIGGGWHSAPWLYALQLRWDAVTYLWQRWVLNYDTQTQEGLLSRLLGGTEGWRIAGWMTGLILLGALLMAFALVRRRPTQQLRPETRALQALEKTLSAHGYQRALGETAGDFIRRVMEQEPRWQASLSIIASLFEQVAYQGKHSHLQQLERRIRHFPPR